MTRALARGSVPPAIAVAIVLGGGSARAQQSGDLIVEEEDESSSAGAADEEDGGWDDDESAGPSQGGGIHFGLRLAYAFPIGELSGTSSSGTAGGGSSVSGGKLGDLTDGQIPLWIDLGWQATPAFMLGGYFSYGFVLLDSDVRDACDRDSADCSASDIRAGIQVQYSFSPGTSLDPWLGAGAGYEWLTLHSDDDRFQAHGWEFFFLQGGLDLGGDSGASTYGPFVAYTFGQFQRVRIKTGGRDDSVAIDDKGMHSWLFVGLRGALK